MAAKFCYGINIDLTLNNIATLRCAAHFLQMTEEVSDKNLEFRCESYLKETVFPRISSCISVLHCCESLLPVSEEVGLVSRIVAAIATNVCREQLTSELSKLEYNQSHVAKVNEQEWWGKSLGILSLEFFQRVLSSLKSKGLKQETVSRILVNYAESKLQAGHLSPRTAETDQKRKQRPIVEAMVGLLPAQSRKSPVPMAFLSGLLKTSVAVSASSVCRGDLERRIALQLDQAILEDLLIPAAPHAGGTQHQLYDADSVSRIFSVFLNLNEDDDDDEDRNGCYEFGSPRSPKQSMILKVSKLLDSYMAEIALDSNLSPAKFIALAELLPDHARVATDGLYRAVDVFLKVIGVQFPCINVLDCLHN